MQIPDHEFKNIAKSERLIHGVETREGMQLRSSLRVHPMSLLVLIRALVQQFQANMPATIDIDDAILAQEVAVRLEKMIGEINVQDKDWDDARQEKETA